MTFNHATRVRFPLRLPIFNMSKEDILTKVKQAHLRPITELKELKKIVNEKYTIKHLIDTSETFLFWKQLEALITAEIRKRKVKIARLAKIA